jgi:cytochrome c-type biogenesis protein CcmE
MTHREQDGPEPVVAEGGILSSNRGKLLVALVVLIGAFGYLAYMAFQSATVYYYTVGELRELGPTPEGRMVRVNGKLVEDSFERIDTSTLAHFSLTDGSDTLSAAHDGILPDLFFNEHSEIILEGSFGQDGVFQSHNVIVKCPSKYVAAEESG